VLASFDVSSFVAEGLERHSLPRLRDVLASYLDETRGELGRAINADYSSFVALSTQLEGFEGALEALRSPLAAAAAKLGGLQSAVAGAAADAAATAASRARATTTQAAAAALLDAQDGVRRAEAAVRRAAAAAHGGVAGLDATAHHLAHAAAILTVQGDAVARAAADLPPQSGSSDGAVSRLASGLAAVAGSLARGRDDVTERALAGLRLALTAPPAAHAGLAASGTLRRLAVVLSQLHAERGAEEEVVAAVTAPLLAAKLGAAALDDGVRGSFRGVDRALTALLAWVSDPASPLATLLAATAGVPGYNLLVAAVWTPLVAHFMGVPPSAFRRATTDDPSSLPTLAPGVPLAAAFFSPAQPATFHANYTALAAFAGRLRVAAASAVAVAHDGTVTPVSRALAAAPATAALAAAWRSKLVAYHSLRASELASRVEKALDARVTPAEFVLPVTGSGGGSGGGAVGGGEASGGSGAVRLRVEDFLSEGGGGGGGGGLSAGEVASAVDALVAAGGDRATAAWLLLSPPPPAPRSTFTLFSRVVPAVVSAVQSIWGAHTFLEPLLPDALQLTAALLGRIGAWVATGALAGGIKGGADLAVAAAMRTGLGALPRAWVDAAVAAVTPAATAPASATAAPAATTTSVCPPVWADANPESLLALAHDVEALVAVVVLGLVPRVRALSGGAVTAPAALGVLATTLVGLLRVAGHLRTAAAGMAARGVAAAGAAAVRGVPAADPQAGAQAAPPPTAALPGLGPRRGRGWVADGGWDDALLPRGAPGTEAVVAGVAAAGAAAFGEALEGVLANLAAMETSLQWLRASDAAGGGGGAGGDAAAAAGGSGGEAVAAASDSDKIGTQLLLDACALEGALAALVGGSEHRALAPSMARLAQYAPRLPSHPAAAAYQRAKA